MDWIFREKEPLFSLPFYTTFHATWTCNCASDGPAASDSQYRYMDIRLCLWWIVDTPWYPRDWINKDPLRLSRSFCSTHRFHDDKTNYNVLHGSTFLFLTTWWIPRLLSITTLLILFLTSVTFCDFIYFPMYCRKPLPTYAPRNIPALYDSLHTPTSLECLCTWRHSQ